MTSLAKSIIYGEKAQIAAAIEQGATVNEIDEYGYTPLIQTAIIDDIEKTQQIINAGADINFTDLTGRSALHWACDNNNLPLAKLLLNKGAQANAYSRAGQPALTMPFLRGHDQMKKLLYKHGAKLSFAQDFVNAKLLGHRYELEGRVDIVSHEPRFIEVELEGFYLEFNLAIVESSLRDFKVNFAGKHLRPYFEKLNIIIDALHNATQLIKYQHYLVKVNEHQENIDKLLDFYPLLIPTVYTGHAISLIAVGQFLIRCDRGEFGRDNGTVIIYQMGQPNRLNKDFIKRILYERQHKSMINEELAHYLELKPIDHLDLPVQISGNCSWANVEAVVPAMMYLMMVQNKENTSEACKKDALQFYQEWVDWDKRRALTFSMQNFRRVNKIRKASKAAMLAAIVYQTYEFDNEDQRRSAEQIFNLFRDYPEYQYVLKSYVEVFQYDRDNPMFYNFMRFIEYFEIDYS